MANGISDGTNMTGNVTREQMAAILFCYAKLKGYATDSTVSLASFSDNGNISKYAVPS